MSTFAQAGAVFNDATRLVEGSLWQNVVEEAGQSRGSAGPVVGDPQTVQTTLQAPVAAGQYQGVAVANAAALATADGATGFQAVPENGGERSTQESRANRGHI
jgi:hypothetical protein